MKKALFLLFLISLNLFSDPQINSLEDLKKYAPTSKKKKNSDPIDLNPRNDILKKDDISLEDLKKIAPSDEEDIDLVDDDKIYQKIKPKNMILGASNIPKSVYEHQIFRVDLRVDLQQRIDADLNLTIDKNKDLIWLNKNSLSWLNGGKKGKFETTLWFEANSTKADLKNIEVVVNRNGEFFQKSSIAIKLPDILKIKNKENFANIAANSLKIKSYKTSSFNEKSNMVTLELSAQNTDLNSFYIDNKNIIDQGVDSIKGDFSNESGYYFAVVNKNLKDLSFSYFNLITHKFENYNIKIKVENEDLSTQTGLNPKESKFKIYRAIVIYGLCAFLVVLFLSSRNTTPLFVVAILLGLNFYLDRPYSKKILKSNSYIRILPMQKSTIFYRTKKEQKVEIFDDNKHYVKVMLPNNLIGWVNESDLKD